MMPSLILIIKVSVNPQPLANTRIRLARVEDEAKWIKRQDIEQPI